MPGHLPSLGLRRQLKSPLEFPLIVIGEVLQLARGKQLEQPFLLHEPLIFLEQGALQNGLVAVFFDRVPFFIRRALELTAVYF